ncbi:hypothetical protein DEDE109153_08065 [Deinococcus deserti]
MLAGTLIANINDFETECQRCAQLQSVVQFMNAARIRSVLLDV